MVDCDGSTARPIVMTYRKEIDDRENSAERSCVMRSMVGLEDSIARRTVCAVVGAARNLSAMAGTGRE